MVTIAAKSTVDFVSPVDGRLDSLDYGEVGTPVEDSQFVRAYCCLCGEAIRVSRKRSRFPNICSKRSHRDNPAIALAERNFYFEQFYADMAEVEINA